MIYFCTQEEEDIILIRQLFFENRNFSSIDFYKDLGLFKIDSNDHVSCVLTEQGKKLWRSSDYSYEIYSTEEIGIPENFYLNHIFYRDTRGKDIQREYSEKFVYYLNVFHAFKKFTSPIGVDFAFGLDKTTSFEVTVCTPMTIIYRAGTKKELTTQIEGFNQFWLERTKLLSRII